MSCGSRSLAPNHRGNPRLFRERDALAALDEPRPSRFLFDEPAADSRTPVAQRAKIEPTMIEPAIETDSVARGKRLEVQRCDEIVGHDRNRPGEHLVGVVDVRAYVRAAVPARQS